MAADSTAERLRMALDGAVERVENLESLDTAADALQQAVETLLQKTGAGPLLKGAWLGHPLHPALTDLPIGFWTSAWVLDFGGRRTRSAADAMVAAGLLCAIPTVAAGLADWTERDRVDRRVGLVHMGANGLATLFYAASLAARRRDHRFRGIALSWAGAAAATAGGYLGGRLAFAGADETSSSPAADAGIVDQQGEVLSAIAH